MKRKKDSTTELSSQLRAAALIVSLAEQGERDVRAGRVVSQAQALARARQRLLAGS